MDLPSPLFHSDRRRFLRHFALSTAVSIIGGKMWSARLLATVDPSGTPVARFPIKISDYPALENQFGSVRFSFADPNGVIYPFVVSNGGNGDFYVVDTRCTHAGCVVTAYEPQEGEPPAMRCFCHGSRFDIMGQVTRGPAMTNLFRYQANFDGIDTFTVTVPGIDMAICDVRVQQQTAAAVRLRLDFPTLETARYRIQFRTELGAAAQEVPFSLLADGPLTDTEVTGTGAPQTVYVESALPRGFFSVALVLSQY